MKETLEKIDLKNLDKSDWQTFRFDQIAHKISETVDPSKTELEVYVGLEHLDAEDIHIRRKGVPADVKGGKLRVYPGDIIFGKRRAYQRKAAVVDFDGICSAHAFVFRANSEVIDAKLFPFFLHSDEFMHRMVDISVGGLSPTINWGDLKHQEFLLPPKDQQARLAELLWAMDEVIEREVQNLEKIIRAKNSLFDDALYSKTESRDQYFGKKKSNFQVVKLATLLSEIQYGISESLSETGDVPVLRMNNLEEGKLDLSDLKYYNPENSELDKFMLKKGDVLFNRTNSFDLVGKVSIFNAEGKYSFASYLIRLKTHCAKLDPRFLNFYLNTPIGLAKIRKYRTPGVSQSNINAQNLRNIPIPLPNRKVQEDIMDKIESIEVGENHSSLKVTTSHNLQKSLINQVF